MSVVIIAGVVAAGLSAGLVAGRALWTRRRPHAERSAHSQGDRSLVIALDGRRLDVAPNAEHELVRLTVGGGFVNISPDGARSLAEQLQAAAVIAEPHR